MTGISGLEEKLKKAVDWALHDVDFELENVTNAVAESQGEINEGTVQDREYLED